MKKQKAARPLWRSIEELMAANDLTPLDRLRLLASGLQDYALAYMHFGAARVLGVLIWLITPKVRNTEKEAA